MQMVDNQAINIERLAAHQADKSFASGLYATTQEATANYYADLWFAGGRGGGPAVVRIDVPTSQLNEFLSANKLGFETPVRETDRNIHSDAKLAWLQQPRFDYFYSQVTMKSYFLEIPLSLVHEDKRYPDRNTRHVYEHLKHTLSHASPFPLPAIDVSLVDGKLVVTDGHKYLWIARDLAHPWIRGIFRSETKEHDGVLSEIPPGIRITPREILEREEALPVVRGYHVYFFEHPLNQEAQKRFLADIAGFFERLDTPLIGPLEKRVFGWAFPFGGECAEFEALLPVGDTSWCGAYLTICQAFSRNVQRIVTFQGARFPDT